MNTYGRAQSEWDGAKDRARKELISVGKKYNDIMFYKDLALMLNGEFQVNFDPHSQPFWDFLDQISREENEIGGCLLSALVVSRDRGLPGTGFFKLAKGLGRKGRDEFELWDKECKRVREYCASIKQIY